jgi:hypothetical protein
VKDSNEIFDNIRSKPFSLKAFVREHLNGILGTVIFHMLVLIIFLLLKMQSYQEVIHKDISIEFPDEEFVEAPDDQMSEEEIFERMLARQLSSSNRAINEARNIEEKISTDNYVQDVLKQIEDQRTEDWLTQKEELEKELNKEDIVPEQQKEDVTEPEEEFMGPTNISYIFSIQPLDRRKRNLPVPVYRCRGAGVVEVKISVDQLGNVTSAKSKVIAASHDAECLAEVAETYARRSTFEGNLSAPANHIGIITYNFIAQ